MQNDSNALKQAKNLFKNVENLTFPEIVTELRLPRFKDGEQDPIDILARLPIRYYVTTGYYDFIERALEKTNKAPKTRLCLLNMSPRELKPEHKFEKDWEPTPDEPMVYHLFGLSEYPESMVISEDDYIEFLMRLSQRPSHDSEEQLIPAFVQAALKNSALLLLGYRLHDWDFRVLFRILKIIATFGLRQYPSVAIQLDPEDQFEITGDADAIENATQYLTRIFAQVELRVHWGRTDTFIAELGNFWDKKQRGG